MSGAANGAFAPSAVASSFERGGRIRISAQVGTGVIEYFVPALVSTIPADFFPGDVVESKNSPRWLIGHWILHASRLGYTDRLCFDSMSLAGTDRAIAALAQPKLDTDVLLRANGLLLGLPGPSRLRDAISWVEGYSPDSATLVPPPSSALAGLLSDLFSFSSRRDLQLWVKQAVVYYQLVHIHPFADGNGRMARAFIAALGGNQQSLKVISLLVAAAIVLNRSAISRSHSEIRDGNVAAYLDCWLTLYRKMVTLASRMNDSERQLQSELSKIVGADCSGKLLAQIAVAPMFSVQALATGQHWSEKNAKTKVGRLVDSGWIAEADRIFICSEILECRKALLEQIQAETRGVFP